MSDEYENTMNKHYADCFQARGISQSGADQLANDKIPTDPADQAMLGAINPKWQATKGVPNFQKDPQDTNCWIDSKETFDLLPKAKPKSNQVDLLKPGGKASDDKNSGATPFESSQSKGFGW